MMLLLLLFIVGIAVAILSGRTKIWEVALLATFGFLLATTAIAAPLTRVLQAANGVLVQYTGATSQPQEPKP